MKPNRAKRRAMRGPIARATKNAQSWAWSEVYVDPALLAEYPAVADVERVVKNDFWIVQVFQFRMLYGEATHLAIRSVKLAGTAHGVEPSWKTLQRIKNEIVGEHREAVQVHPRENDVMDQADMYHLFVLPEEWPLPFGLHRENGFRRSPDVGNHARVG